MGWNGLEWVGMGWNGLESSGMNLEWVGMALGIWQNELGMEFHLDSMGIQPNGRFQPFHQILDGIPWSFNIPVGVCWILPELMGEGKVLAISTHI